MTVAIARVTLFLGDSHSLKDKRMVLRKIKDLVRNKFNVSIAQVSEDDRWQRAVLGLSLVGSDRKFAESAMDEVLRFIRGHVQVSNEEKELQSFGDELIGPDFKHWEELSLIHISEPTRLLSISYAVFCLKKKKM